MANIQKKFLPPHKNKTRYNNVVIHILYVTLKYLVFLQIFI